MTLAINAIDNQQANVCYTSQGACENAAVVGSKPYKWNSYE